MPGVNSYVPDGWATTRVSMGNFWVNYVANAIKTYTPNSTTTTNGKYASSLDSFVSYAQGDASETRMGLLTASKLTGQMTALVNEAAAIGARNPCIIIYSNDFSHYADSTHNIDIVGNPTINTYTDSLGKIHKSATFDITTPINQFANLGLQSAAFNKLNEDHADLKMQGSILFNPDGIGQMATNVISSQGYSINSDYTTNTSNAIYLKDWTDPSGIIHDKTAIDYKTILNNAVNKIYDWGATNPNVINLPTTKPDPTITSNGIAPISFAGDASDYLAAQSWMIKQFAGNLTISTVANLWAGPWSVLSLQNASSSQIIEFVGYAKDAYGVLGWGNASGQNQYGVASDKAAAYMDFIAFDRYERDDTSTTVLGAMGGAYAFNATAWNNAISFYNQVTTAVMPADKQAIMLVQIPAASAPTSVTSSDILNQAGISAGATDSNSPHFGIAPAYFFGDAELVAKGLNTTVAAYLLPAALGSTYGAHIQQDENFKQLASGLINEQSGIVDPSLSKVFAIQWGGGNTASPISATAYQWPGINGPTPPVGTSTGLDQKNWTGNAFLDIIDSINNYKTTTTILGFTLIGSSAIDYLPLSGPATDYTISLNTKVTLENVAARSSDGYSSSGAHDTSSNYLGVYVVTDNVPNRDGIVYLNSIERLEFKDSRTALDLNGNAGVVDGIYDALLNRSPDKKGLGYWLGLVDHGMQPIDVAAMFLKSSEFTSKYASQSNSEFVEMLYTNGLERSADAAGLAFWVSQLDQGITRAHVVYEFAHSAEQLAQQVALLGATGLQYE